MTDIGPPPRLVFQLTVAERSVRRWIDARSGDTGIGAAGAGVLFHLASHDHASIGDVTAALDASPSGMSGLVNRLERAGLLSRSSDPADARATRLTLTPLGRQTVASARVVLGGLNTRLTDGFTTEELQVVSRWLTRIAHELRPGASD
ncbi:MarR family winged helix-turn-helix transcriptional regulator [Micromonospora polyrhachis]|uniref:DNA-binding MarR family transcriptional regulator n=1 Tax=Micromonospora polyrhachis TaxID=1282883 RepID=A0A7W7WS53_9ACTN|nr:MarR family winged helix-turn-helix transcriptional regulator [Micromonospora polyrhachis]MBB4961624.1 DNA-binding MarR family transcriptional regulator [Micromonospora polyrhachis]